MRSQRACHKKPDGGSLGLPPLQKHVSCTWRKLRILSHVSAQVFWTIWCFEKRYLFALQNVTKHFALLEPHLHILFRYKNLDLIFLKCLMWIQWLWFVHTRNKEKYESRLNSLFFTLAFLPINLLCLETKSDYWIAVKSTNKI